MPDTTQPEQNKALEKYIASLEKTLQDYKKGSLSMKEYTEYVEDSNRWIEEECGADTHK